MTELDRLYEKQADISADLSEVRKQKELLEQELKSTQELIAKEKHNLCNHPFNGKFVSLKRYDCTSLQQLMYCLYCKETDDRYIMVGVLFQKSLNSISITSYANEPLHLLRGSYDLIETQQYKNFFIGFDNFLSFAKLIIDNPTESYLQGFLEAQCFDRDAFYKMEYEKENKK